MNLDKFLLCYCNQIPTITKRINYHEFQCPLCKKIIKKEEEEDDEE